jgi:hypothetical protein
VYFSNQSITWEVIQGSLVLGLSSVGLWEVSKKVIVG